MYATRAPTNASRTRSPGQPQTWDRLLCGRTKAATRNGNDRQRARRPTADRWTRISRARRGLGRSDFTGRSARHRLRRTRRLPRRPVASGASSGRGFATEQHLLVEVERVLLSALRDAQRQESGGGDRTTGLWWPGLFGLPVVVVLST